MTSEKPSPGIHPTPLAPGSTSLAPGAATATVPGAAVAPARPCGCASHTFVVGAISAGLAVAIGAFGAHGLKSHTDAAGLAIWETAVRYQAYHAFGLMILSLAWQRFSTRSLKTIGVCFVIGTLIFSGSLYALVLTGIKWLGAITPVGGLLFIIGWLTAAITHRPVRNS